MNDNYLNWVIQETSTKWWHDSAESEELDLGLERGAIGVTTNPVLSSAALNKDRALWNASITEILDRNLAPESKAEALMRIPVTQAAGKLLPQYLSTFGGTGFVCAQVNPLLAGDRDAMFAMAKRLHAWAPNIAVKLPATAAGLDVLEDCVAEGITSTATVSFTVPQVVTIAERHRAGIARAKAEGIAAGKCFSAIMIGRLDDYLRDVAHDHHVDVSESDIRQAGLAVTKRAYAIYEQCGYEAVLLVEALRGDYHLTELVGADLVMSIHPTYQESFVVNNFPHEERIDQPIAADVLQRLRQIPEFVRAFEPDGMTAADFASYGATQRTLAQFCDSGWKLMESFP